MKALVLEKHIPITADAEPLVEKELEVPRFGPSDVLIRISCCGVCHTELDEIKGRVAIAFPIIPGNQVLGIIEKTWRTCRCCLDSLGLRPRKSLPPFSGYREGC